MLVVVVVVVEVMMGVSKEKKIAYSFLGDFFDV